MKVQEAALFSSDGGTLHVLFEARSCLAHTSAPTIPLMVLLSRFWSPESPALFPTQRPTWRVLSTTLVSFFPPTYTSPLLNFSRTTSGPASKTLLAVLPDSRFLPPSPRLRLLCLLFTPPDLEVVTERIPPRVAAFSIGSSWAGSSLCNT